MKRFLPWLLAIVFVILATGCSAQGTAPDSTPATPPEQSDQSATEPAPPVADAPASPAETTATNDSVITVDVLQQSSWKDIQTLSLQAKSPEDVFLQKFIDFLSSPPSTRPDGLIYKATYFYVDSGIDIDQIQQKVDVIIDAYNSDNEFGLQMATYLADAPNTEDPVIVVMTTDFPDDMISYNNFPLPKSGEFPPSVIAARASAGTSSGPWSLAALQSASWDEMRNWPAAQTGEDIWLEILVKTISMVADDPRVQVNSTTEVSKEDITSTTAEFLEKYQLIIDAFNKSNSTTLKIGKTSEDASNIYIPLSK